MSMPTAGSGAGAGRHRRAVAVVAFLLLAYPVTFLLFQGGRFCGPFCFQPTPRGVVAVVGSLAVLAGLAVVVASRDWTPDPGTDDRFSGLFGPQSLLVQGVLLAVFTAFVGFLVLDSLAIAEAMWKPVVLPFSFLVFLPVWVLYAATFPLAIVLSVLGVESPPALTLVLRAVVVFVGFPLSVLLQTAVLNAIVRWRG